jgi:ATP-dependent helicase Lhr and Lhr-like helicase
MVVAPAPGETARMPFWHGDYPWRPYELGCEVGEFRRKAAAKVRAEVPDGQSFRAILEKRGEGETPGVIEWLRTDYALDDNSAWNVVDYVAGQLDNAGAISSDRAIVVEVFENELGEVRAVIQSPFGGRVNGPWGLALVSALRERTGIDVEVQSGDDGILLRFPGADEEVPLSIVAEMGPAEARERILREMADSALFGARFRQNAARALLLPGNRPGKRTPFWLQRLKARDLLQAIRRYEDFPILIETYRDCLEDVMDIPHLEQVLQDIQRGEIQVVTVESIVPSPVAQGLISQFTNIYMYEWDAPRAERQLQQLAVDRVLLQDLLKDVALDHLLRPEAVEDVTGRLQHTASTARARSADELAMILDQVGDLSPDEMAARAVVDPAAWIEQLAGQGRIREVELATMHGLETRWASAELALEYERALRVGAASTADAASQEQARRAVLQRFLWRSGPVTVDLIRARYDLPPEWLDAELKRLVETGELARGRFVPENSAAEQYLERRNLEQIHRQTLTVLRREVRPVPRAVYADFLAHWQHLHPAERLKGHGALVDVLQQLRAVPALGRIWERDLFPLRVEHYDPAELEDLCQSGELIWIGSGGADPRRGRIRFIFRGEGHVYGPPDPSNLDELSTRARAVHDLLRVEGALFFADIQAGLGIDSAAAESALVELVMNGLVTNDSLQAMRQLVHAGSAAPRPGAIPKRRPWSTLEAQLAERRGGTLRDRGLRRPTPAQLRAARQRVSHVGPKADAVRWMGRWSLVHRLGIMGRLLPPEEQAARQARQLLQRWGIVTHEWLAAEETGWDWGAVYAQLRLMEMRGEVRRGLFVEGLGGLQFALPDAVEQLRARRDALQMDDRPVVMNAGDPANLYGPALPGGPVAAAGAPLAFARHPSTWLVQWAGWPVLVARGGGASVTTVQGATDLQVQAAILALSDHLLRYAHRLTVEMWNGAPVLSSGGSPILEASGFHRDYLAMTLEHPH